jgi:hypothetical protein
MIERNLADTHLASKVAIDQCCNNIITTGCERRASSNLQRQVAPSNYPRLKTNEFTGI